MKRTLVNLVVLLAILGTMTFAAAEPSNSHNLFGYVMETSQGSFVLMTDDEMLFSFKVSDGVSPINEDDAVVMRYNGTLNPNAEAQSVEVTNVLVLSTIYGTIESADGSKLVVRMLNDDGADAARFIFGVDDIDLVVGEDGIMPGDDVEVCFKGNVSDLVPDQMNKPAYVHVTVYGQIEDTME